LLRLMRTLFRLACTLLTEHKDLVQKAFITPTIKITLY
jgi:hypothetical protein